VRPGVPGRAVPGRSAGRHGRYGCPAAPPGTPEFVE
jgi:hypothetical protein